jgi:hypothetical protein
VWEHPVSEDAVERVRKTWKAWLEAVEALRAAPCDPARAWSESRTRVRLAEVLEDAGMLPLLPRERGGTARAGVRTEEADGR